MKHKTSAKLGIILIMIAFTIAGTGCDRLFWGSNALSSATGWLFGSIWTAANLETQCYQNGVRIDCADLPADLGK